MTAFHMLEEQPQMPRSQILIIENDRQLTDSLQEYLEQEGFQVTIAHAGQVGLRKVEMRRPDLLLLGRVLSDGDGLDICRELRARNETRGLPIVLLSPASSEIDQVVGFALGADDYVTKPFNSLILLHRIKALQRRVDYQAEHTDVLEHLGVTLDLRRDQASVHSRDTSLTPTEFRLLRCLLSQPGRVFSRPQLIDACFAENKLIRQRTIDVHMKTIRRKLGDKSFIETVRGCGYRVRETRPVAEPK